MTNVAHWLEGLGLDKYAAVFAEAEIEFDVLSDLTDGELEKLGIPLGPRKRMLRAIASLSAG
ncbi:MAG: SAM domain-containing protein, partial [Geminicoccaceae bacterium]